MSAFEIPCSGCGTRLRVQSENAGLKHRCPVCRRFVVPSQWQARRRERRAFWYLSGGLAFLGLLPIAWPTGLYLIVTSASLLGLEVLKLRWEEQGWADSESVSTTLAFNGLKGLRDTATGVAVGIGIVCGAQSLLQAFFAMATPATVRNWESWIVGGRAALGLPVKFRWLPATAFVLLVVSLIWPKQKAVKRYKYWRGWASRALVTLTTISAFTVLTSTTIDALEREWVAERKTEVQRDAGRIKAGRRELLKHAYTKEEIARLPDGTQKQIREFFQTAAKRPDGADLVRELAERIGKRMPGLVYGPARPNPASANRSVPHREPGVEANRNNGAEARGTVNATDAAIERTDQWSEAGVSRGKSPGPSFKDADRLAAEAGRVEGALGAAQLAVEEAIKTVLGDQLSPAMDPLVKLFVKSLMGSSVKTFLSGVFPQGIDDFADAVRWVSVNLKPDDLRQNWIWPVGTVAEYRPPKAPETVTANTPEVSPGRAASLFPRPNRRVIPFDATPADQLQELRQRLLEGWVVSRNANGKMFVHEMKVGNSFRGLKYLIKESVDGSRWTIYAPGNVVDGAVEYGERIGVISKPSETRITSCACR
jgi:hypothetical protein